MLLDTDIKPILKSYQSVIETELESLLKESSLNSLAQSQALDSIRYSVMNGGKRLRAILALVTAEAVLKSEQQLDLKNNLAVGLALAIELVHCGSLIHDDLPCMDDDDLRRGKPTNHKVYGEAVALLAGDTLLCYPIEVLIGKTPQEAQCKLGVVTLELIQAIKDMIAGQALDLELPTKTNKTIEDLKQMQELKTGAILRASVRLAAMLAGANAEQVRALDSYATKLGLAFQIADDILDYTASTEELGKTAGKDLKQNKFTYVQEYGIDKASQMAANLIDSAKQDIDAVMIYAVKLKLIADYVISRNN
jgi:geranylgeranyl diphosphate synthase type II